MKPVKRGRLAWGFPSGVLLAWAVAAWHAPQRMEPALHLFTSLLRQVAPALLLVFALLFVVNLFAERPWIARHMGQDAGPRAWFFALGAGVLASGPPWPWYALAGQLMQRGVRPGLAAAFLYARAIKLPLLPLLVHYFGLAYAVTLSAWLLIFALGIGLLMQRLAPMPAISCPIPHQKDNHAH